MNARHLVLLLLLGVSGCGHVSSREDSEQPLTRILFGSCIDTLEHPMLDRVLGLKFDLALLLGDNIYADTRDMAVMEQKYQAMKRSLFWQALRKKAPVMATWDDHDLGENDAGEDYLKKKESQELFLDFMDEPKNSRRRSQAGVYSARIFGPPGQRVQVILLDTRYFRSRPATGKHGAVPSGGPYVPHPDPATTILGEAQWKWLEQQLREPAEIRIIGSSIQFLSEFSGAEAWANFPHEKQRMLDLLVTTDARGVIFVSGDRHWAELSRLERPGSYPLYDLTSSALTQVHPRGTPTPNIYREGRTYHRPNAGLVVIEWEPKPAVTLRLVDANGRTRIKKRLEDLGFGMSQ